MPTCRPAGLSESRVQGLRKSRKLIKRQDWESRLVLTYLVIVIRVYPPTQTPDGLPHFSDARLEDGPALGILVVSLEAYL